MRSEICDLIAAVCVTLLLLLILWAAVPGCSGPPDLIIRVHQDVNGCWTEVRTPYRSRVLLPGQRLEYP